MPESIDFVVAPDEEEEGGGRQVSPPRLHSLIKDNKLWQAEINDALVDTSR